MAIESNPRRVLLGMSGGIDSCVAISVLQEEGLNVTGLMLQTGAVYATSIEKAKSAASRFGIELIIKDYSGDFEEAVVNPFIDAYSAGLTPNPCVLCNPCFKFKTLIEEADRLGVHWIATGHYARVAREGGASFVVRGASEENDQSYFLYRLPAETRGRMLFPLGGSTKSEVRERARALGMDFSEIRSSQEACFTAGGLRGWLMGRCPEKFRSGPAYDSRTGKVVGAHSGTTGLTLGQRRGHGVATGGRSYIVGIDAASNSIYLGDRSQCFEDEVRAGDLVLGSASASALAGGMRLSVKTRSSMKPAPAEVRLVGDTIIAKLDFSIWKSAPGQSLVCYEGEKVACGGIIR